MRAGICISDAGGPTWFKVAYSSKAHPGSHLFEYSRRIAPPRSFIILCPAYGNMMDKSDITRSAVFASKSTHLATYPRSRCRADRLTAALVIDHHLASGYIRFILLRDTLRDTTSKSRLSRTITRNSIADDALCLRTLLLFNLVLSSIIPVTIVAIINLRGGNTNTKVMERSIFWKYHQF